MVARVTEAVASQVKRRRRARLPASTSPPVHEFTGPSEVSRSVAQGFVRSGSQRDRL